MALAEDRLAERPAAAWRRFAARRASVMSLVALVIIAAAVAGADLIAPYGSGQQHLDHVLAPPGGDFLLGTDTLGRDTFSQVLFAGRISLVIGLSVAFIASLLGTAVGVVAGYLGGRVDAVLMRFTDTLLALPLLMMIILLARILGDSAADVVLVLSLLGWMALARIIRAKTLALREQEFVAAARSMGASTTRIMVRHLLPNLVGEISVAVSLAVAGAILAESVLSFLGLGVSSAHTPTWGNMIGGNEGFMTVEPWLVWAPGLAIVVTVLCVNFIGDGLRDAFDVRSDGRN
ncbi:MAG: ABC transporter permease [Acidimicrobiaceae bacterium]|nr:ABC transporter permease [Acidimicrobiaceae bacterium]MDE0320780.1 ABC transporter permease [Acidimicrobiaceae bacterium]